MGARLLLLAQRLGGAALPVGRARQRDRIADALGDAREMSLRGRGIAEEAQRNPAGGELMLDAIVLLARHRGIARDPIG